MIESFYLPLINLEDVGDTLSRLFLIFPHYSLSDIFYNLNRLRTLDSLCDEACKQIPACKDRTSMCDINPICCGNLEQLITYNNIRICPKFQFVIHVSETGTYSLARRGIGLNLILMIFLGVVCFSILLLMDLRVFESIMYYIKSLKEQEQELPPQAMEGKTERDVADEKRRVSQMTDEVLSEYNLVLRGLIKLYHNEYLAVNQISIAIKRYNKQSIFFSLQPTD